MQLDKYSLVELGIELIATSHEKAFVREDILHFNADHHLTCQCETRFRPAHCSHVVLNRRICPLLKSWWDSLMAN